MTKSTYVLYDGPAGPERRVLARYRCVSHAIAASKASKNPGTRDATTFRIRRRGEETVHVFERRRHDDVVVVFTGIEL